MENDAMADLLGWILLLGLSLISPINGSQAFVIVPAWAMEWVPLPQTDFACHMLSCERCADVLGHESDVKFLTYRKPEDDPALMENRSMILRVFINTKRFDPKDILKIVSRIKSGADPKKKRTIFLQLGED
jgi:hypothetical protein